MMQFNVEEMYVMAALNVKSRTELMNDIREQLVLKDKVGAHMTAERKEMYEILERCFKKLDEMTDEEFDNIDFQLLEMMIEDEYECRLYTQGLNDIMWRCVV